MAQLEWHVAIDTMKPHIVRIATPSGSGTGFLLARGIQSDLCILATAAHVVSHPHERQQPIHVFHETSGDSIFLKEEQRAITIDEDIDTASIILPKTALRLPEETLRLTPEGHFLKTGNEIGWMGYPSVSPDTLCFFSGRISAYLEPQKAYLVDGVVINGVSGGPVFSLDRDGKITIIGVISAYIPNRATGEMLPGVGYVSDVVQLHSTLKFLISFEDAKRAEKAQAGAPKAETTPSSVA